MILKMASILTKRIITALTITKGHRNDYRRLQTVKIGSDSGACAIVMEMNS